MGKRIMLLGYFIIAVALSGFLSAQEIRQGKCLNVVDGDTIEVDFDGDGVIDEDSERVEVLGVECFEPKKRDELVKQAERAGIPFEEAKTMGIEAKEYGKNTLLNKLIKVEIYGGGKPGSVSHGYVFISGTDYGASLLKKGLAKVVRKNKKHPKYQEYEALEQ